MRGVFSRIQIFGPAVLPPEPDDSQATRFLPDLRCPIPGGLWLAHPATEFAAVNYKSGTAANLDRRKAESPRNEQLPDVE